MTKRDGTGESNKEDDSINPFVSMDDGKPLGSSKKAEEPVAAEEPLNEPTEEPIAVPMEDEEPAAVEEPLDKAEEPVAVQTEEDDSVETTEDEVESDEAVSEEDIAEPVSEPVVAKPAEMNVGTISSALRGTISFFTAIPVSASKNDIEAMNSNLWLTPIIGFIFALFAFVAFLIGSQGDVVTGGVLAFGTVMILNKFLHADGLIDTGDAIAATGDVEKKRRAMKDPAIGAGGIAVAVLVLGGTLLFYTDIFTYSGFFIFVAFAEMCGRNSMVTTAAFGNYVEGGMASDSVKRTGTDGAIKSIIFTIILAIIALWLGYAFAVLEFDNFTLDASLIVSYFMVMIVTVIASTLWGWVVSKYANEKLGGVSGDVLGASVESGRLIAFIVTSIIFSLIVQM